MSEVEALIWLVVALASIAGPAILYARLEERHVSTPVRLGIAVLTCGGVLVLGSAVTGMIGMVVEPAGDAQPAEAAASGGTEFLYGKTDTPYARSESVLKTGSTSAEATKSTSKQGAWRISRERNLSDNTPLLFLSVEAISGQMPNGVTPSFYARCKSRKTDAYIVWGAAVGDDGNGGNWKELTVRIGGQRPERQRWTVSTDREATFAPARASTLLRKLGGAQRFTVEMTPHQARPVTAVFPLDGFQEALAELQQTCNS